MLHTMMDDLISINLWYAGKFEDSIPKPTYVGGYSAVLRLDVDKLSYFEIVDYVLDIGSYKSKDYDLYCFDNDGVLKRLLTDRDVYEFANSNQQLDIYVQQGPITKPLKHPHPSSKTQSKPSPVSSPYSSPIDHSTFSPRYTKAAARRGVLVGSDSTSGSHIEQSSKGQAQTMPLRSPIKSLVDPATFSPRYTKASARRSAPTLNTDITSSTNLDEWSDPFEGLDSDGDEDPEEDGHNEHEVDEVISCESDEDDDELRESIAKIQKVNREYQERKRKVFEDCLKGSAGVGEPSTQKDTASRVEAHSSYEDSDGDVNTPGESDDDNILGKKYRDVVPLIDEHTNWKKFKWVAGTRFPTRESVKAAVRKYSIATSRNLYVKSGCKTYERQGRLGYRCVDGCPFSLYISFHSGKGCYMVKRITDKHNCQRNMDRNRQLTA
ncbi:hypothetical protein QVD17_20482 [Tagetes erecta]|uniref:PB1-like domain-containing protein n=1 Tax=Tagetes erecta TaxID=13708 RepID=A0AAD8KLK6_TARER|nr:hypothetical protein QVD17_20482 [Tagetes erecta]